MRLYVDLRNFDKKGQVATAKELVKCATWLKEMAEDAA